MKVVSINVGFPRVLTWGGREVRTAFRKEPVSAPVEFRGVNLVGDEQADRSVHGGERKAVYVYPVEHYGFWREELDLSDLRFGSFGENLTTQGWLETEVRVGDLVRIGSAEFAVTIPRKPCYKMEAAFQRDDMIRRFHQSRRSGFYLSGRTSGRLAAGDEVEVLSRVEGARTIAEVYPSYAGEA